MAEAFFRRELDKADGQWKEINRLTGRFHIIPRMI